MISKKIINQRLQDGLINKNIVSGKDKINIVKMNHLKPLKSMQRKKKLNNQYIQYPLSSASDLKLQSSHEKPHQASYSQITPANLSPRHIIDQQASENQQSSIRNSPSAKANPFLALSELKATQQQYQMLRKRMQVLKLKQQKNNCRSQLNHRKILLHSSIQKLAFLEKQKISEWKQQNQERVESQRYSNLQQKLIHHKTVKQVQENLMETKLRQYEQRKQQAKHHQIKIKEIQEQVVQVNKQKVNKIKKLQLFSKLSIESFNKQKLHQFKDKKFKETGTLQMRKIQKEQEIKKLLQLEMEMIERQSRSRILFDSSTEKLKQMLNPQSGIKSSRITKNSPKMNQTQLSQASHHRHEEIMSEPLPEPNTKKALPQSTHKSHSDSLTKASSYRGSEMKSGFSLPDIKLPKKFA